MGAPDQVSADLARHMAQQDRLSDIADAITEKDRLQAREELIEALCDGKKIGSMNSREVWDCAINDSSQYRDVLDLLESVLCLTIKYGDDQRELVWKLEADAKRFMERYVDANPDMVTEKAEQTEQERRQDEEDGL